MTQAIRQNAASIVPMATPILAMHRRFEEASDAHHALDCARGKGSGDRTRLDGEMADILNEQDALRVAILRQVPNSDDEFAVVLYHASIGFDLIADNEGAGWIAAEGEALRVAMQHLFDYAASNHGADPLAIGRAFSVEAMRTRKLRLLRTGNPEA